jgi:hypothetical protein
MATAAGDAPVTNVVPTEQGAVAYGRDQFQILIRPAEPVLDAVASLWEVLSWFDSRRHSRGMAACEINNLIAMIPKHTRLYEVQWLFRAAAFEPAPETCSAWPSLYG